MTTLNLEPFAMALQWATLGLRFADSPPMQGKSLYATMAAPHAESLKAMGLAPLTVIPGSSMGKVSPTGRWATPPEQWDLSKASEMVCMGVDLGAPEGDRGIVVMKHRREDPDARLMTMDFSALERRVAAMTEPPVPSKAKPKGDVFTRIAAQNLKKAYAAVTRQEREGAKASWSLLLYTKDGEKTLQAVHGADIMSDNWEDRYA